jgi:Domain of unknown function (DUF4328)
MIQVCSRCGTRWNVRDRRRQWCPRCHGALMPPHFTPAQSQWSAPASGNHAAAPTRSVPPLPSGYRWIAVRPGAAPPPRRPPRPLGPTPRYAMMPRWGLMDPAMAAGETHAELPREGPSSRSVHATLITTVAVLGVAALLHLARYALLILNRSVLLNPIVAGAATWLAVVASVAALFTIVGCAYVLTGWLIARRGAAFEHRHQPDPRPLWALRAGCLVPVVNLAWAPVFVMELALAEDRLARLRRQIWVWWGLFVASTAVSVFATATSFTSNAQGIADNTVSFIVAYLLAMATVITAAQLLFAFERAPVEQPVHRWLVVGQEAGGQPEQPAEPEPEPEKKPETPVEVEPEGQEPAA